METRDDFCGDNPVAYDTETTGLLFHEHKMFAFSLGVPNHAQAYRLDSFASNLRISRQVLGMFWFGKRKATTQKVMHNAKFDLAFTEKCLGRRLDGHIIHDTSILSHIVRNHAPSHGLKQLAYELAGFPLDDEEAVLAHVVQSRQDYSTVPKNIMDKYQCGDVERTILLFNFFYPMVQARKDWMECYDNEIRLTWATLRMIQRGLKICERRTKRVQTWVTAEAEQARKDLCELAGGEINPGSTRHLRALIYDKSMLGLPVENLTSTKREPSTDAGTLLAIAEKHPEFERVRQLILKYRSFSVGASKLQTYLDFADEDNILHPDINPNGAKRTGRESCQRPNLQNVQREDMSNPYTVPARDCFVPKPGYVNVLIDYAGIEAKLLANAVGHGTLFDMAMRGEDTHAVAADAFFGFKFRNADDKTRKYLRTISKNAFFGVAYGASGGRVAGILEVSYAEGDAARSRLLRAFPALKSLIHTTAERSSETGYIETSFGRRLHVIRSEEHKAVNYLIQGTAAGILKRGHVRVHELLERETGGEAGVVLPIHDELIIEWPRNMLSELPHMLHKIRAVMVDFQDWVDVPMEIEVKIAAVSWAQAKEYESWRDA